MVWVRFTKTEHVANARKDVYHEGKVYDLAEASVLRWESMGSVERITKEEAEALMVCDAPSADAPAERAPVGTTYTKKVGKKFDVYQITEDALVEGIKINKNPLNDKEANDLMLELAQAHAAEQQRKAEEQGQEEKQ